MKRLRRILGMPVLAKELAEQAARPRTYIVRAVYAALLFFGFVLFLSEHLEDYAGSPLALLGSGRAIFEALVGLQFAGIYLFLPAMMSGVLTAEKERDSLGLLFLTDLKPREILFQKYLGRLVPMAGFLLLSLPLMAIAYGFGGISEDYLAAGVYTLALACLQAGAIALSFSAFCRTSAAAFLCTYLLGALFYLALPLLDAWHAVRLSDDVRWAIFPPYIFFETSRRVPLGQTFVDTIPILVSIVVFLGLARFFLVRRAFAQPRRLLLAMFRRLDGIMLRLNRWVGSILLVRDRGSLPEDEPVAWRETTKKAVGKAHYLFRIFVLVGIPVFLTICGIVIANPSDWHTAEALSVVVFLLWGAMALLFTVLAASAVAEERSHGTLDVLLTTPLLGREIVAQKVRGLWRLMLVLAGVLLSVIFLEAWWEYSGLGYGEPHTAAYLCVSLLCLAVYLPMLVWVSLWIGLRVKRRGRAILAAVIAIAAWVVVPVFLLVVFNDFLDLGFMNEAPCRLLIFLSPGSILVLNEMNELARSAEDCGGTALVIALNFVFYGSVLWWTRRRCLQRADEYLGRVSGERRPGRRDAPPDSRSGSASSPARS